MNTENLQKILTAYLICFLPDIFVHFHNALLNLLIYSMKDRFLTITALSGEFPYKNIYRVGADSEYIRLMRHRLYKEQFISLQTEEHLKGLVITGERMSMYKESYPERFKYSEDRTRMEVSRRYRKQLFALTYCSLANADIEFFPDKKPFIFSRSRMIMFLIH